MLNLSLFFSLRSQWCRGAACWYVRMSEERKGWSWSLWGMQTWSRETPQLFWDFQACGETGGGGMLPVFSPRRLNSNLRTNYCFAYLHLEHRDYPSLAGNITTLHLSMVHLSSMSPSECSLICFGFQVQWRERVMVMLLAPLLRKRALDSQMRHLWNNQDKRCRLCHYKRILYTLPIVTSIVSFREMQLLALFENWSINKEKMFSCLSVFDNKDQSLCFFCKPQTTPTPI